MDKQTRPGESEAVVSVILGITSCVFVILTYLFWQKQPFIFTFPSRPLSWVFWASYLHLFL